MSLEWQDILEGPDYEWEYRAQGATDDELRALQAWFGRSLPDDYGQFLRMSNGAVLSCRDMWYIQVWPTNEVPIWSDRYGFGAPKMPGAIAFGDNGGGEGLVFDVRPKRSDGRYPIYLVNFVSIGWKEAIHVADDFKSLLSLKQSLFHEVTERDSTL